MRECMRAWCVAPQSSPFCAAMCWKGGSQWSARSRKNMAACWNSGREYFRREAKHRQRGRHGIVTWTSRIQRPSMCFQMHIDPRINTGKGDLQPAVCSCSSKPASLNGESQCSCLLLLLGTRTKATFHRSLLQPRARGHAARSAKASSTKERRRWHNSSSRPVQRYCDINQSEWP